MYRVFTPLHCGTTGDFQRDMETLVSRVFGAATDDGDSSFAPDADLFEAENGFQLILDLPGTSADDVDIEVVDGVLSISGTRVADDLPEGSKQHWGERRFGSFKRSIRLDETVDVDNIQADFTSGVLKLTLPKITKPEPKKIKVNIS
jgi:HSP20 family protein